jgi:hypothetical protein
MIDKTAIKISGIDEVQSDFAYWQSQPHKKRLAALEEIRREYNAWKYGEQQEFQRVYTIIKQKDCT